MRRIFVPEVEKEIIGKEKLYKEKLRDFYSASNRSIVRLIKCRGMGWTEREPGKKWVRSARIIIVRRNTVSLYRDVYLLKLIVY